MAAPPDYRQLAAQDARKYGVPPNVFLAQIKQESGFSPTAHSGAGADGIAQFIPSTARAYGVNTRDPASSLDGAARYDRDLIKRYGSVARALSAYNSGKPDAYQDPSFAGGQTYNYVRSILGGAGGAASSGPPPAAAASPSLAGSLAPQQAPNPTAGLLQTLQGAQAPGPQKNDYTGFYGQLGAALKAKRQGALGVGTPAVTGLAGDAQASTFPPGGGGVSGPHVSPVAANYTYGRIDQGVDISQKQPYVSPGSGVVTRIGPVAGGTNLGVYIRLDHPISVNGRSYPGMYVWHTSPLVKPGQRISAGQPIMSGGSAEVGFATASGHPVAPLVGGLGAGTKSSSQGADMKAYFDSLLGRTK